MHKYFRVCEKHAVTHRPPKPLRSAAGPLVASSVVACVAASGLTPAAATPPEVRGTWLTTTGPDHIRSGFHTQAIVDQLDTTGLNTVYVEAWKNGFTNYDSRVLTELVGVDTNPAVVGDRDLLDETTAAAHRRGLIHSAWFEYGFSSQFLGSTPGSTRDNALTSYARSRGWLLEDQDRQVVNPSNAFAWMNPAVPEVRELLIDLTLEAVQTHDLDGVQFDDRLAWPNALGFGDTTAAIYRAETGRDLPAGPGAPDDARFKQWRQDKVTQFAAELNQAIDAYRPDLLVSVSPSVDGFSQTRFNADWKAWAEQGLFDEFVPQVYRRTLADFRGDLPRNLDALRDSDRLDAGVIGLRLNGTGADTPLADLRQMIVDVALAEGGDLSGHSIFFSDGVIDNAAALAAFYGPEEVTHPRFAADHRPAPLVGDNTDGNTWSITVDTAEQYRLIAEVGGRWVELNQHLLEAGDHAFHVPGASGVELLRDRRPIEGDTDFDRDVDLKDLQSLADHFEQDGAIAEGDVDWDGFVDEDDLTLLRLNWGWGVEAGTMFSDALVRVGLTEPFTAGDVDGDGLPDGVDVSPFVDLLEGGGYVPAADMNGDGIVDALDIDPFVALLTANGTPQAALSVIPEPSSAAVMMGLAALLLRRRLH
mgnify:FL=1